MAHNGNVIAFGRRLSVALVLVVAVVASPLLADYCAVACEHTGAASTTAPACHHGGSPIARIGSPPAPCGQGHQPTMAAAPSLVATTRTLMNSLTVLPGSIVVSEAVSHGVPSAALLLPPDRVARQGPSPLRI